MLIFSKMQTVKIIYFFIMYYFKIFSYFCILKNCPFMGGKM